MQTFLPFSDFRASAAVLDVRRLGKQRIEVLQILRALTFEDYGWRTHPAVTMWNGFTAALVTYGVVVAERWVSIGFADTVGPQIVEFVAPERVRSQSALSTDGHLPPWLGSAPLHRSHRAALLRKEPQHYGPLFPDVDPDLPYVWPESRPLEPADGPVSAWVVRAGDAEATAMQENSFVGLRPVDDERPDAPFGHATRDTKRRREIRTFVSETDIGDRVVVPAGDRLLVAEVDGAYEWWTDAPLGLHHARRVRWSGQLRRKDLRRPVHLQNPRTVFALRDEPRIVSVTPTPPQRPAP